MNKYRNITGTTNQMSADILHNNNNHLIHFFSLHFQYNVCKRRQQEL